MTKMFWVAYLTLAAIAEAGTVPCAGPVANVTSLTEGNGCLIGKQALQDYVVNSSDFSSVVISITGATLSAGYADVDYGIATNPSVVTRHGSWVTMVYEDTVQGLLDSVRLTNRDGEGVWIYETVCSGDIRGNHCYGDILGQAAAGPGESVTVALLRPASDVHIQKYLGYLDATLTSFSNETHQVEIPGVPEPPTVLGLAGGLLLLVAVSVTSKS